MALFFSGKSLSESSRMRPWATWRSMVSSKNWQNAFGPCWGGVGSTAISTRRESLRWWFQIFFYFHPENWGRWTHFDRYFFLGVGSIFQRGWFNHQLVIAFGSIWHVPNTSSVTQQTKQIPPNFVSLPWSDDLKKKTQNASGRQRVYGIPVRMLHLGVWETQPSLGCWEITPWN